MAENAKFKNNVKVVHLDSDTQRLVRAKLARLPAAIHAVHEKGRRIILDQLKAFFDRADDALFELADKAHSNQEQNLYFDSMREVRVQRRSIENSFSGAIDSAFAALVTPTGKAEYERFEASLGSDVLSLVEHDELEEILAVDSSIDRANKDFGESIQQLSLRLDSLVPVKVYQKNNPLGPDVLCEVFIAQAKKLDIGIKAKLILFKLFDKEVIGKLNVVYAAVNQILKEHNILPSLSSGDSARDDRRRGGVSNYAPSGMQAGPVTANSEVLAALKNILGEQVVGKQVLPSASQVAANELIQLLSKAQHSPMLTANSSAAINVRTLLAQLQQQLGQQAKVGRVDDEVMNLVNMLFDFILEDRNLAAPMKALISRMQIPIIKVAVADKSFFTKGGHVARRLLNEMATASIGWQGDSETCKRDPLYKKIDSIVRHLIENFDTDVSVFGDLLADFSEFLEKEKKRAAVLERRTVDAEDGKAKAEIARITVKLEIEIRTVGMSIPDIVARLVENAWSNVLFVTALKYGYGSSEWKDALSALEELVWSVKPPVNSPQRQKLIQLVPGLLRKLRAGLDTISYNPFEMSELFKSLEKVHLACIRGKALEPKKAAANIAPQLTNKAAPPSISKAEARQKAAERSAVLKEQIRAANQRQNAIATASIVNDTPQADLKELEKGMLVTELNPGESDVEPGMPSGGNAKATNSLLTGRGAGGVGTASERQGREAAASAQKSNKPIPKPVPEELALLPASDPQMDQVSRFVQGAWFDLIDANGTLSRCRLAAYIKPTGKYIFVNRNGMKVAEKTQLELAYALKKNAIKVLDNSMLFDRALETIVTSLRKN